MKRSPFRTKAPPRREATQCTYTPRPRDMAEVMAGPARAHVAAQKECALQHEGYMRLVRALPCAGCGVEGFTQFCHADEGKGLGIKSDCRLGWPGCGPRPGVNGCHFDVGSSGFLGREGRRKFEAQAGKQTRATIRDSGQWPATLPAWPEDEGE